MLKSSVMIEIYDVSWHAWEPASLFVCDANKESGSRDGFGAFGPFRQMDVATEIDINLKLQLKFLSPDG